MPGELLHTAALWALIFPAAFALGSFFQKPLKQGDPLLNGIIYVGLGWGLLSCGVLVLGLCHALRPVPLTALLLGSAALVFFRKTLFKEWVLGWAAEWRFRGQSALTRFYIVLFGVTAAALLAGTLTPEIGGDALAYQLNIVKNFLRQNSLAPDIYDYNSFFPLLVNNLYLLGLALGGVFAAKLFHFFSGVLLTLAIQRWVYLETKNKALSLFLALVFWLTPGVFHELSTAYIDVALSFYSFLACITLLLAFRFKNAGAFFAAGLFAGFAFSIKYLFGFTLLGLGVLGLMELWQNRRDFKRTVSHGLIWFCAMALVCGYWFWRNHTQTGNPFFPYFGEFFGGANRPPSDHYLFGMGRSAVEFLLVFWNMFFHPDRFGAFSNRIGLAYLLLSPFWIAAFLFLPRARPYGIVFFGFFITWFIIAQADRWFFPNLPMLCVGAAYGLVWAGQNLRGRAGEAVKKMGIAAGVAVLIVYALGGIYHYRYAYRVYTGQWSMQTYLRSMERTAPAAEWVNQNLPETAKLLFESEPSQFYFKRDSVRDVYLRWKTKYPEQNWSLEDMSRFLKELSVTHVLISRSVKAPVREASLIQQIVQRPPAVLLYQGESENVRDDRHVYQVYALNAGEPPSGTGESPRAG